jgi:hypothetical protein
VEICLLGLVAMLAYDDDDEDLGVEYQLVYSRRWPLFKMTVPQFEKPQNALVEAGILLLDTPNNVWHLQSVGGQSAQSLKKIVIDGLIRTKLAIVVFIEAVSGLATLIRSRVSHQPYLSLVKLTEAYNQIAHDKTKERSVVEELLDERLKLLALLWSAKEYVVPSTLKEARLQKNNT